MSNGANGNRYPTWQRVALASVTAFGTIALTLMGFALTSLVTQGERMSRIEQDHMYMLQEIKALRSFAARGERFTESDGQALKERVLMLEARCKDIEGRLRRQP